MVVSFVFWTIELDLNLFSDIPPQYTYNSLLLSIFGLQYVNIPKGSAPLYSHDMWLKLAP